MIMNPVVQGGTAEEKVYKITDMTNLGFPKSAKAGGLIVSEKQTEPITITIVDTAGNEIPSMAANVPPILGSTRAPTAVYYYFVMPAENVTITG